MNQATELNALISSEKQLYAIQEPNGTLRVLWGQTRTTGPSSLSFRKFHSPRIKAPSSWEDFHESTAWFLREEREFKHSELLSLNPCPRPGTPFSADRMGWNALFEKALTSLFHGTSRKLVLAREIFAPLEIAERDELIQSLPHLLFHPQMENAFRFLLKSHNSFFFGATPEMLFERREGKLQVPAVAGTIPLNQGVSESTLRDQLLGSGKDRAEHQLVVEGIVETLERLGFDVSAPNEPSVLRTSKLLHLFTPVIALDKPKVSGEELIEALHPTPAIGGLPREEARSFLFEFEGFDRGLFSAPIMFRTPDRELCLVGIRSGLITKSAIHLFAGAGVVTGSTAEGEWTETENKLKVMDTILFGGNHG